MQSPEALKAGGGDSTWLSGDAGCWGGSHFPPLVGLSVRQLECPHDLGTDFPRERDPEKTVRQSYTFDNLASEVTCFSFGHILFVRSELLNSAHIQGVGNLAPLCEERRVNNLDIFSNHYIILFATCCKPPCMFLPNSGSYTKAFVDSVP